MLITLIVLVLALLAAKVGRFKIIKVAFYLAVPNSGVSLKNLGT